MLFVGENRSCWCLAEPRLYLIKHFWIYSTRIRAGLCRGELPTSRARTIQPMMPLTQLTDNIQTFWRHYSHPMHGIYVPLARSRTYLRTQQALISMDHGQFQTN